MDKDMFYFAELDLKFIQTTKDVEGLEDGVIVHCQQAVEKYMKFILKEKYGLKETGHNLLKLADPMVEYTALFRKYRNIMRFLKDSYFDRRYDTTNYISMSSEDYEEYLSESLALIGELRVICLEIKKCNQ